MSRYFLALQQQSIIIHCESRSKKINEFKNRILIAEDETHIFTDSYWDIWIFQIFMKKSGSRLMVNLSKVSNRL